MRTFSYRRLEETFDFEWRCTRCGEHGTVVEDKVWKFCPYCGCPDLEIRMLEEKTNER